MKIKTKHQLKTHEVLRIRTREGMEFIKVPIKRHEHKVKGRFDIDLNLMNEILRSADPGFNKSAYFIQGSGNVNIGNKNFKYRDFYNLLSILRQAGILNVSDTDLHNINHEYCQRYETV